MRRIVLAVAALAIGATAVAAQTDVIAQRKALMKRDGDQAKTLVAMIRGQAPFDAAQAKAVFAGFAEVAEKSQNLFPDNSKTGGDTAALPKIWENKADFNARLAKFAADSKTAEASVHDLASLKAAVAVVGKNCSECHELYRAGRANQ
jgi:cytochrome c556